VALGFAFWAHGLMRRAGRGEQREETLRTEVNQLEARLCEQGERLRSALTIDELTGALSRRAFVERLEEVIQRDARLKRPLAFLLVSVPDARSIAGRGGRDEADGILQAIGEVLQSSTRGTDTVGRLGYDLFGVILGECDNPRPAVHRILSTIGAAPRLGGRSEPVCPRLGAVTVGQPNLSVSFGDLLGRAEAALSSVRGDESGQWAYAQLEVAEPPELIAAAG
jgi:diguanylate cyclase (GGDEF)-like protein